MTEQLVHTKLADVQPVRLAIIEQNNCQLDILRLDKIHPTISGNKWFKLKYNLEEAIAQQKSRIVTIGGAYSNHVLATAAACERLGIKSLALIKGQRPREISCTLQAAIQCGMEIQFKPRSFFRDYELMTSFISDQFQDSHFIEEGGRNENGIRGATEILSLAHRDKYQYICCSIGTGTMMAGIIHSSLQGQKVIGFSSLKISDPGNELLSFIRSNVSSGKNYEIIYDYHFGGFARYNDRLIQFMNDFFTLTTIPTDIVYCGKLIFGILDMMKSGYFASNSNILVIHSGGLQGNCSLPPGTLLF